MNSIRKFKCEKCQEFIHGYVPLFLYQGAWVCGDCLKDAMYDLDEFDVAELLGLEIEDADTLGAEEAERSDKLWQAV